MKTSPVSQRYATALFELAREKNAAAEVDAGVAQAGSALADPQVASFFEAADVPAEEKRARLAELCAGVHPLVKNLLLLLADKGRYPALREIATAYRHSLDLERGVANGVVESARPLAESEVRALEGSLGAELGKKVVLENRIAPELLAGARVLVENRLLDASARGRLDALRADLLRTRVSLNGTSNS